MKMPTRLSFLKNKKKAPMMQALVIRAEGSIKALMMSNILNKY